MMGHPVFGPKSLAPTPPKNMKLKKGWVAPIHSINYKHKNFAAVSPKVNIFLFLHSIPMDHVQVDLSYQF